MKFKSLILGTSALATAAIILSTAAPALAQRDEIIVTATKREQTLQQVPVAVTVVSAETIERARILDILDLQSVVPSLRVSQLQNSSNTSFIIRGFGNGANNVGVEPSVGVFIDGVYRSRSAAQISDLPNIQRVEVLRGPQSTLFGKNASAGVISVVTKKPSFETEGFIELGIGNFGARQFKGYLSGPLSDKVAYSLGGTINKRDGYTENIALGTRISDRDRFGVRGELLFEPTDNSSWRLIVDYDEIDEACCTVANLVNGPTGGLLPFLGGTTVAEDPFSYQVALNFDPINTAQNGGVSFHGDVDFENFTFTTISSYRSSNTQRDGDIDFTSVDLISGNQQDIQIDTFTQELRLASNGDNRFHWLVGGFYFNENIDQTDNVTFGTAFRSFVNLLADPTGATDTLSGLEFALGLPIGTTFHQPGQGVFEVATQDNQSFSLFGQFDFDLTERLTATFGVSYVNDRKDVTLSQINTDLFSQLDFVGIGFAGLFGAFTGGAAPTPANFALFPGQTAAAAAAATTPCTPTSAPGSCNTALALQALQFLPALLGIPSSGENGQSRDENVDFTLRLAYDWTDNVNVYASYATGYKATSWNLSRDSRPTNAELDAVFGVAVPGLFGLARPGQPATLVAATRRADPEEAFVYEVGLKASFARGSFNVTVFDQTLENFQSNVFNGVAFTLANAQQQSVQGVEFDLLWFATDNLSFGLAGTFLDPVFDEFTNSTFGDVSGTRPGGIHGTSLSTRVNWNWQSGSYDGFVRADYQYDSDVSVQGGGTINAANAILAAVGQDRRSVNTFNASTGISKNNWDLTFYGRNIFNDEFLGASFATTAQPGSFSGYPNQPRTYGVLLRKNF